MWVICFRNTNIRIHHHLTLLLARVFVLKLKECSYNTIDLKWLLIQCIFACEESLLLISIVNKKKYGDFYHDTCTHFMIFLNVGKEATVYIYRMFYQTAASIFIRCHT